MKRPDFLFSVALVCAASCAALAATERQWTVDPVHSSAEFSIKHLGFFHVRGTIPIRSSVITIEGSNTIPIAVNAVLDPSGVDTKNGDRDDDLRSANFFDVKRYPEMSFKSTKVVRGDKGNFSVVGDLTLHGVTKSMTLNAHFEGQGSDGRGRQHVGYTATGTFDRRDFKMNYGQSTPGGALVVGNDVSVDLAIEAVAK